MGGRLFMVGITVLQGERDLIDQAAAAAGGYKRTTWARAVLLDQARQAVVRSQQGHFPTALPPDIAERVRRLMRTYSHPPGSVPSIHGMTDLIMRAGLAALEVGQVPL